MADGTIVIDARIRKQAAEKDLASLRKDAASTAREIAALDKKIASIEGSTKLKDNLDAATAAASATEAELQKVNDQLDAAISKRAEQLRATPGFQNFKASTINSMATDQVTSENPKLVAKSSDLAAQYEKDAAAVEKANVAYQAQQAELAGLNQQRTELNSRLQTENGLVDQEAQKQQAAAAASAQHKQQMKNTAFALDEVGAVAATVSNSVKSLGGAISKAFQFAGQKIAAFSKKLNGSTKLLGQFQRRMKSIIWGALVFNGISSAIRGMTSYMSAAIQKSASLTSAVANLKGAAATAAQPIVTMLTPAIVALTNAAATALGYVAKLFSFFTGKSVAAMKASAKAIGAVKTSVAGFDELNVLSDNSGGSSGVDPNYDFSASSGFLDTLLQAVEAGDWALFGYLIADKINASLANIDWSSIRATTADIANGIVDALNSFVSEIDPGVLGATIAGALMTAFTFVNTFVQGFNWGTLGNQIGNTLNAAFAGIDWTVVGQVLTNGLKMAFETLHGFLQTFDWVSFQADICTALQAAFANVDWVQAAVDVSTLARNIIQTITAAIAAIDWTEIGTALKAIDWKGIFGDVLKLIGTVICALAESGLGDVIFPLIEAKIGAGLGGLIGTIVGFLIGGPVGAALGGALGTLIGTLAGLVGGWVNSKLIALRGTISSWWDGIVGVCKDAINGILAGINGLITGVVDGMNAVVGAINTLSFTVPRWVPKLGGSTFGFNLGTITAPQIPYLAQGAVIPPNREFMAVLGDQTSGTNIEAPLETIKQAVAEVLAQMGGQDITINETLNLDGEVVYQNQRKVAAKKGYAISASPNFG